MCHVCMLLSLRVLYMYCRAPCRALSMNLEPSTTESNYLHTVLRTTCLCARLHLRMHISSKNAHAHCLYFVLLAIQFSCGHLAVPDSGQFVLSNGTYIGSIATYSCNKGYSLVGFETRICQADRTWSGLAPTCESMLFKNSGIY